MQKDDLVRLKHMLDAAKEAMDFLQGKTRRTLNTNRMLVLALVKDNESVDREQILVEIDDRIFLGISSNINNRDSELYGKLPCVLVMSYLKKFNKGGLQIWSKAIEELKKADKLTIIGCSLRDEDTLLRFALRHFGEKETAGEFTIEVVDIKKETKEKIRHELVSQAFVGNPDKQTVKEYECLGDYLKEDR